MSEVLTKFREPEIASKHRVPCTCNAVVLVWTHDRIREGALIALCRRCGTVRLDRAHGITLELAQ